MREFPPQQLQLYLVTDEAARCRYGLLETVERALAGGVSIVQYRSKLASPAQMLQEARALRELLRPRGIPLLINNHVELACAIDADGAHVGHNDMPAAQARQLLGPHKILGLTAGTAERIAAADTRIVDYLGIGPVKPTPSKTDAAPSLGVANWAKLAAQSPLPVVAIGGIDAPTASELRATGCAAGIAIISAICASADPAQAARELLNTPPA